ncbi:hypothetical protein C8F01DRAFT_1367591 [Mycena amicta]|nr:hypothetical protein C8F01DRAFT_1367591 [Mycena amicta]
MRVSVAFLFTILFAVQSIAAPLGITRDSGAQELAVRKAVKAVKRPDENKKEKGRPATGNTAFRQQRLKPSQPKAKAVVKKPVAKKVAKPVAKKVAKPVAKKVAKPVTKRVAKPVRSPLVSSRSRLHR